MAITTASNATTVVAGNALEFTFDVGSAVGSDTDYTWRIIREGFLPATDSDFPSLTGTFTVAMGQDSGTFSLTPSAASTSRLSKNFRVVVEDASGTQVRDPSALITITSADTYNLSAVNSTGGVGADVLVAAGNAPIGQMNGGGSNDFYVITRYQHGDVSIDDAIGASTIKFDRGTVITDFAETSVRGGAVIASVVFTLATGAEITVALPAGSYSYQIGAGTVMNYADFKTAIMATGTNTSSALASPVSVDALTTTDDITPAEETVTQDVIGSVGNDILGGTGNRPVGEMNGGGSDDYYIVTRLQYGNVTIDDAIGASVIKFDFDVTITDFSETSVRGGAVISRVVFTLETGADIAIPLPAGSYSYQIGEGEVMDYAAFKTAIGATGTNATSAIAADFTVPLPSTGPMLPDTGSSYFRYDTDGFYQFDDTNMDNDMPNGRANDMRVPGGTQIAPADTSGSNRMLIDGNITSDQSNLDLHGGDDVYEIDLGSFGRDDSGVVITANTPLDIEINDTEGTNYFLIIADPNRDAGDNTGTSADATRITGIQNFAAIGRVVLTLGADTDDDDTTIETIGTITIQSPNNSRIAYANGEDTVFVNAADLTATNFEASLAVTDTTTPDII